MISLKLCRSTLVKCLAVLVIISACLNSPVRAQESEDSQIFISGFNAYQQKDYATTISRMNEVLQKHPDSPLRDMVLFWLSRAYYKSGNQQDAARYMSQFIKEYPDNPLKGTVDEELLALTARYDRGESLKGGSAEQERRAAAAKAEAARAAAEKAEQERLAAVRAEEQRRAAEAARLAAARTEADRLAAEKAEHARAALKQKADQERVAAARIEEEQRKAAEAARAAAAKPDQERQAAVQKVEAEKVDMAEVARQQAELVRQAQAKAEQKRLAALKAEEERQAADRAAKAEMVRQMTAKAEAEQKAAAVEEKRLAAIKAEEDRIVNEKAERLRVEREKIENERKAALAAEQSRLAAAKAEADRKVAEAARIAEQEREKVETAKRAAAEAEQQKQAALKAEQERLAAQRAEKERQAAAVVAAAEPAPAPAAKKQPQKAAGKKAQLREKAIAQYQAVIEKYPNSKAAATAAVKLRELGVTPPRPQQAAVAAAAPSTVPSSENSQILRLEVAQFAGLEFNLTAPARPINASQRVSVPFEIRNQGNGSDSFYLESGFPTEYGALFSAASAPDQPVSQTPTLASGETFKGQITVTIPAGSIDGQRILYPVKATSRTFTEAAQTREIRLVAAAPLLRAMVRADRTQLLPGDRIAYRVSILNVGSTAAQDVSFRLTFPPQLEPLDAAAAGFRQELKAALAVDGLQVKSGESREFTLTFQLKDDTLAGQELLTRGELANNQLKTSAAFVSNGAVVQQKRGVAARAAADRQVVIPGQTVTIPFVVTNTGNVREKFRVVPSAKGQGGAVVLFHDLNRDGVRQAAEPVITEIGPLAPREEASIGMEIATARTAVDGSEETAQLAFVSEGDETRAATVATRLLYSRPVLQLAMAGRDGRLKPGEVSSFDLTVSNRGSNLAQTVELQSVLPEQLELVAADPLTSGGAGPLTWRFKELGAGEKRTVKVSFRVRPGTGMGTSLQVKNILSYEDQLGNRY